MPGTRAGEILHSNFEQKETIESGGRVSGTGKMLAGCAGRYIWVTELPAMVSYGPVNDDMDQHMCIHTELICTTIDWLGFDNCTTRSKVLASRSDFVLIITKSKRKVNMYM